MASSGTRSAPRRVGFAIAATLVVAALLRCIGIAYGLPAVYNPDEVAIMNRALSLSQTGLDPRNFLYPSLYFYALFAWEGLWFVVGRLSGIYDSLSAFELSYFVDPSAIYVAGRALTALCGVATVYATGRLARALYGPVAGVAAALLLAVAPLAVRDAHYVKHDVPVTLLVVLTCVVLARDLQDPAGRRRPALAGVLAGLAMSTHYYAVFVAVPVALVALLPAAAGEPSSRRWRRLAIAAAAAIVAFFAASPFLLAEPATAVRDVIANRQIVVDRATEEAGAFGSLGFYASWLAGEAMGGVAFALAVAGAVLAARSSPRRAMLLLAFPVLFLLFIGNTVPASRYLNPVLPFAAVLAGATIAGLARWRRAGPILAAALLAIAAGQAAWASVRVDRFIATTDTRTLAQDWIEAHVPAGASVLIQPYSVPLRMSREALAEALTANLGAPERATVRFRRQLALDPYPAPAYRTIYLGDGGADVDKIYVSPRAFTAANGLEPLEALAVTWVVMKRYNEPDPAMTALNAALERDGRLVASFSPYAAGTAGTARALVAPFLHNTDASIRPELERPGPIIDVWTID